MLQVGEIRLSSPDSKRSSASSGRIQALPTVSNPEDSDPVQAGKGCGKALALDVEVEAQRLDVPRNRVLKDDALVEIATNLPKSEADFAMLRALPRGFRSSGYPGPAPIRRAVPAGPTSSA